MNEEQNNQPNETEQTKVEVPKPNQSGLSLESLNERLKIVEKALKKENKI